MIETWLAPFGAGVCIGTAYFWGLWHTVKAGLKSDWAPALFLGSLVVRLAVTVLALTTLAQHRIDRLLICLTGFLVGRFVTVAFIVPDRLTRPTRRGALDHATK